MHPGTAALELTCSSLCVGLVGLIGVWLQDKLNASTEGIKVVSAEIQMRHNSRSASQECVKILMAQYESDQEEIERTSTNLASSRHELDNLEDIMPKHFEVVQLVMIPLSASVL